MTTPTNEPHAAEVPQAVRVAIAEFHGASCSYAIEQRNNGGACSGTERRVFRAYGYLEAAVVAAIRQRPTLEQVEKVLAAANPYDEDAVAASLVAVRALYRELEES